MKKHLLFVSMIAALCITGCNFNQGDKDTSSKEQSSSINESSSGDESSSSSAPKQETKNDNFTLLEPNDLSSMSSNCKKYVDDMRAQQKKLIAEKGANADYYLNDLYGTSGVDITKGIPDGDNGGYRPANHQSDYLDPVAAEWEKGEKSDESKGIEIEFTPAESLKGKEYTISYASNPEFHNAKTIKTSDTKAYIKNLFVNEKYYVKVSADGKSSQTINFTTGDYPRWIDARPMFNVRDMGGYMTSSGQRIRQGLIYRGGEITPAVGWKANSWSSYTGDVGGRYTGSDGKMVDQHITSQTDESKEAFRNVMGMVGGLEIDLRSSGERNGYTKCGFAENNDISYMLKEINSYDSPMRDAKKRELIKDVFEAFAQADQRPVYFHCYGGADRTGVVGFMLGAVLGMSYTDLVIDFELTRMIDYLKNDLHWSNSKTMKDSMEEFLINECKISQTTIDTIRNIMLEPAK